MSVTWGIDPIQFWRIRQKYSLWRLAQFGVPRSISEEREDPDHQPGQGEVPPTTATTQISLIGGKRTILTLFIRTQSTSQIFLSDMNHLDFRISAKSENIPDILLKFWKQLSYWRLIITSLKINAQEDCRLRTYFVCLCSHLSLLEMCGLKSIILKSSLK